MLEACDSNMAPSVFSPYADPDAPPSVWQGGAIPDFPALQPMSAAPAPAAPTSAPPAAPAPAQDAAVPQVFSPLDTEEGPKLDQLKKLQWQDQNHYGTPSNHPGTVGKILHGLSVAGQVAGNIFAPHVMADIPGTEAYRNVHEQQLGEDVNKIEREKVENQASQAQASDATARAAQTVEQTRELPGKTASEEGMQGAQTTEAQSRTKQLDQQTQALTASSQPLDQNTAPQLENVWAPVKQQLGITTPLFTPGMTPAQTAERVDALKTLAGLNEKQQEHKDTVDMRKSEHADSEADKAASRALTASLAGNKQDTAARSAGYKAYEPAVGSAERFNVMTQNYEDATKNNNQQAMLSLLYNHLGMTMGLQKGARMTQSIIEEAQKSQPWLQGIKAKFDPKTGYLSGVTLGPQQMRDMVSLAQDRYKEDVKSARAHGQYIGLQDDGPTREPNKATINYYKAQTGGDGAKAKALAQSDGWTVQ